MNDLPRGNSTDKNDLSNRSAAPSFVHDLLAGKSLQQVVTASRLEPGDRKIAVLWADMRSRWAAGDTVPAEAYLPAIGDPLTDTEQVVDLIYSEFALREEHGVQISNDEYRRRFPEHSDALERQISLHEGLRDSAITMTQMMTDSTAVSHAMPDKIGKYVVLARIGEGGQATVYRAVHPELSTEVAIKLERPLPTGDRQNSEAIQQEGALLSELKHPGLARVYDCDFHGDRPFLVLEYIRGPNLRQVYQQSPPTPIQAAVWMAAIGRALAAVHRTGMLHLDVKPANIAIDSEGQPRLIDFGMGRRFDAWSDYGRESDGQMISGTLPYMAPEQARGDIAQLSQYSDTFGLGATLYFLLTGQTPYTNSRFAALFTGADEEDWNRAALDTPRIPQALREICTKAMATNPQDRFTTTDDFANELEVFAAQDASTGKRRLSSLSIMLPLVASLLVLGWFYGTSIFSDHPSGNASGIQPLIDSAAVAAVSTISLKLDVRVFDSETSRRLVHVVPLENGDQLQIRLTVPPALHATLFVLTSDGDLRELAHVNKSDNFQTLQFPDNSGQAVPLTGSSGTEFVFACASDQQPVTLTTIQSLWGASKAWPAIPDMLVLRFTPAGIDYEQRDRDFGPPSDLPNPEAVVRQHLEDLKQRLQKQFTSFEGIVFSHR